MIISANFESDNDLNAEFESGTEIIGTVKSSEDVLIDLNQSAVQNGQKFVAEFHGDDEHDMRMRDVIKVPVSSYEFGHGLIYDEETNTVSVDVVNDVIEGDLRPVTSSAVQVQVGNIEAILRTI